MPTVAPKEPEPGVAQGNATGHSRPICASGCNRTQEYGKLNDSSYARCMGLGMNVNYNGTY
jgi:hypothetical protein